MRDLDRDLRDTVWRMTTQTYIDCNKNMYIYTIRVSSVSLLASTIVAHSPQSLFGYRAPEAGLVVDYPVCHQSLHGIHPPVAHSTDLAFLGWKVGIKRKRREGGWKEGREGSEGGRRRGKGVRVEGGEERGRVEGEEGREGGWKEGREEREDGTRKGEGKRE